MAKQGIVDFHTFLLKLEADKFIDDISSLTAKEKLTLKDAFTKGQKLQKANPAIADDIEKAIAEGDFKKLDDIINGKYIDDVITTPVVPELTENTVKHLKGEINRRGQAVGGHMQQSIDDGIIRVRPGESITPGPQGSFTAKIDVLDSNGNWVQKTAESSFFPVSWTENKILSEISSAFNNKALITGNTWEGMSNSGILIRMYIKTDGSNIIISAFPII